MNLENLVFNELQNNYRYFHIVSIITVTMILLTGISFVLFLACTLFSEYIFNLSVKLNKIKDGLLDVLAITSFVGVFASLGVMSSFKEYVENYRHTEDAYTLIKSDKKYTVSLIGTKEQEQVKCILEQPKKWLME